MEMKKFAELEYVRPDMEKVRAELREDMEKLKNAADYGEFRKAYLSYVELDTEVATAQTICHIRNTINMLDEYYEKESQYFNAELPKYDLVENEMGAIILNSPFRAEFEADFGKIITKNIEVRQMLSKEELVPDLVEEANVSSLYSKTVAAEFIDFRGEKLNTVRLMKHMQSTDREERKEAFEAWAQLFSNIAPKIDEIYDRLVTLRSGMAAKAGFENFIPMGYLKRRRYDYTAEDLKVFRRQVREVIVPACVKLYDRQKEALGIDHLYFYDESLSSPDGNAVPIGDKDYLVGEAQKMYRELSPETGEFFDFMVKYDLFDLISRKGKRVGGYCTVLPKYRAPFIFSNFNGTSGDVNVLTHEAGHAFAAFMSSKNQKLPELCHSTSEINEIHSMSMELFTHPWMERFFGDKADQYRRDHLADAIKKIPYMVCVDEFQHHVYEKPEMTAMERRKVWRDLEKTYMPWRDYDGNEFLEEGGFWMQKQHIFLYPFYYVDYAMAQIGALEFYTKMTKDRKQAFEDYLKLCKAGGSMGYFDLLSYSGLHNVLKEGSVKEALSAVFEELGV